MIGSLDQHGNPGAQGRLLKARSDHGRWSLCHGSNLVARMRRWLWPRLFGSVARGDAQAESDVDFLIEAGPVTSSWFPAGLILDLEDLLGKRVEVVTERGLDPLIRDRVLREAVPL